MTLLLGLPEFLSRARLILLRGVFPTRLKVRMLDELVRVTADGFAVPVPPWSERSFEARLDAYARFTAQEAGLLVAAGDSDAITAVKARLRRGAAGLGTEVRNRLGIRRPEEALEAWKLLYRQIGIDVAGELGEEITVSRCFFASYYGESVCDVIGALDDGLAAGLFGGASLEFEERLTGGKPCCCAILRLGRLQG